MQKHPTPDRLERILTALAPFFRAIGAGIASLVLFFGHAFMTAFFVVAILAYVLTQEPQPTGEPVCWRPAVGAKGWISHLAIDPPPCPDVTNPTPREH